MSPSAYTNGIESFRRSHPRVFALTLGASVAVHIVALLLMPEMVLLERAHPERLDVMMVMQEPPRVIATRPSTPPVGTRVEKPRRPPQEKKVAAPVEQRAQATEPPPVLAVPRQVSVPEPVFTAPAPELRAAPEPPAPAPREVARAAPKADSAAAEKTTAPVFDAAYLRNPEPVYPVIARRRGEQGTVLLKVLVTREGTAASVGIDKSSGSAALDQAAMEAVRKWRFTPARRGAQAVESPVLVPIVFRLEGVS